MGRKKLKQSNGGKYINSSTILTYLYLLIHTVKCAKSWVINPLSPCTFCLYIVQYLLRLNYRPPPLEQASLSRAGDLQQHIHLTMST